MRALPATSRRSSRPPGQGAARDLRLPRRFGPYDLFAAVGRGGMAELFLARSETDLGATRNCVVKMILPAFADDPRFASMLVHEAKLAAQLSHRRIVQVLDLGRAEGRLYIAMEYVEGFDLGALVRECVEQGDGIPAPHALGIVADVLEGLDYAHRRVREDGTPLGVVHRDISPSNILISYEGEVKLCDFGIARANDVFEGGSVNEALKGKAGYMSPEHARAEEIDARADVFAAGIVLWELLAGQRLYRPRSELSLLDQAKRAEIPPLPERGLPNPDELERIVGRALAADRRDRYPTAGAFLRDLEGYLAGAGLLASRLKLGAWIADVFGTDMIEERRESERRLPKSVPPPRASGVVPSASTLTSVVIPAAPRVPRELLLALAPRAPESLGGTTVDIEPSSPLHASEPRREEPRAPERAAETDEELLAWARRRGIVSFFIFFSIAVVIGVVWLLTH